MSYRSTVSTSPSRLALPCRSNSGISWGQRANPLPKPWVRLGSTKPPLRPLACPPHSPASRTVTVRAGSRSLARSAAHSPA